MTNKEKIIEMFHKNVKGRMPNVEGVNPRHAGKYGQWLEAQFGVSANGNNAPDILGYELKNETTSKTSFGDWSANYYIFTDSTYNNCFSGKKKGERQNSFVNIFGKPNMEKNGRCSWSGSPCPKINVYNDFGQILIVTPESNIAAVYSYSQDKRANKESLIPKDLQKENLVIALWYGKEKPIGIKGKTLKEKVEDKFNQSGWFTCKKNDETGVYEKICFGEPLSFENWLEMVKKGVVFFDSGMYYGNARPYSMWRAENSLWNKLIVETYD